MDMVKRLSMIAALSLSGLSGCDPFAPGEPEAPSLAGSYQPAKQAENVPGLWAKGILERNLLQTTKLVDDGFVGSSGGSSMSKSTFDACLERLAKMTIDTVRFGWRSTPTGDADSAWGDVDWILRVSGGASYGGRATWAVSRDNSAEWHLVRWVEASNPGNWSDVCGGF